MNLSAQIKATGNCFKVGAKRPKAKKRIRPVSPKRAKELAIYRRRRPGFLKEHPWCQIWLAKNAYNEADAFEHDGMIPIDWDNGCGVVGYHHVPPSTEIHHTNQRHGIRLLDERYWLAASRPEHNWVKDNQSEARRIGVLI
jgi:hypothetical protein